VGEFDQIFKMSAPELARNKAKLEGRRTAKLSQGFNEVRCSCKRSTYDEEVLKMMYVLLCIWARTQVGRRRQRSIGLYDGVRILLG
jgi:hypothetical protein